MNTGFNDSTAAEYLRHLVATAGVVVWEYDWSSDAFTYVSDAAVEFLGFPKDEWLAPGFWPAHVHPDELEEIIETCTTATDEGRDHILEYRLLRSDGSYAWVREIVVVDPIMRLRGHNRGLLIDVTVQHGALDELREIERRYRAIISMAGLTVQEIDSQGRIVYVNDTGAEIMGASRESLLGTAAIDALPEAEREKTADAFLAVLQEGRSISDFVLPFTGVDGVERMLKISAAPLARQDGVNRGLLALGEDITPRIELERTLQHKVEDLEAVFRLLRDLYFRLDADGRYTDFIAHEQSQLFMAPEQFLGRHYTEVVPTHIAEMQDEAIAQAHRTGEPVTIEYEAEIDGETSWFEARILPLPSGDSSVVVRDVSPKVRRSQQLEASERRLRSVVDNAPFGMHFFELLPDGRLVLVDANPAADKLLNISHRELFGLDIEEAFTGLAGSPIPATYRYVAQKGGSWHTESVDYEDGRVSGAFEIIAFQISPGLIATHFVDIKERRAAAQKELEYQARLRSLTTELTDAEVKERRHLAEELHDRVSQSLAVARMHLDAACAEEVPDREGVNRARALLDSAIKETRALTTELAPPVLYELGLASALRWVCEHIAETHGLEVGLSARFDERVLSEDRKMTLFRATRELLMNVVKHAQTGNAWVDLNNSDGTVFLTVSDQGVGFDPEVLSSAETGFGLFSIKERLPGMGGTFNMRSRIGDGTQVTITLPCKAPVAD